MALQNIFRFETCNIARVVSVGSAAHARKMDDTSAGMVRQAVRVRQLCAWWRGGSECARHPKSSSIRLKEARLPGRQPDEIPQQIPVKVTV